MHPSRSATVALFVALCAGACNTPAVPPPPTAEPKPVAAVVTPPTLTPPPAPAPTRVVVVGGGLAGLVTAYELQKRGIEAHVLEASDTWGGRVTTAYYGEGLFAEAGMQEMWEENPILGIAKELGVAMDSSVEEPFSSVVIDGKLLPYVQNTQDEYFSSFLAPEELQTLNGWLARAKALRQVALKKGVKAPEIKKLQAISFAAWVQKEKLPKRVEDFIRLTIECELAADWTSFSGVVGLLEYGVFLGGGQPNYHASGGNVHVIRALVGALRGPKTLGALVLRVDREKRPDGTIAARVAYQKDGHVHTVEAERVVLAVPFFRLHQIAIEPPLSDEKWQGILTLTRGGYTVVHLLVEKAAKALWLIDGESPFPVLSDGTLGVIYGVMHESPPEQPLEVFSLLIHGAAAHGFHMVAREKKIAEILKGLDALWPGLSTHVKGSYVYSYHPAAIAVWPPGRSPIDERSQALRTPELGLYLAGDWTISGHSDGAVTSGIRVAKQIAKELPR